MSLPKFRPPGREMPVLDAHRAAAGTGVWTENSAGETLGEEAAEVRELSHAERARTIFGNNRQGVLSLNAGEAHVPVGLIVPFVLDEDGSALVGVRDGVNKAMRLGDNVPVSLTVAETPLTASRSDLAGGATIVGKLHSIKANDRVFENVSRMYARIQPADGAAVKQGHSLLYRIEISIVLIALGTGEMVRVALNEYTAASMDPLSVVAPSLASHLSDDGGSLLLLTRAFGGVPNATSARLCGIDQYGIDLLVATPKSQQSVRLSFAQPVTSPDEVRLQLETMARAARFKLGVG